MLCEECRKRPATVHFTKIVNDHRTEAHLCEHCARERGEFSFSFEPTFSIYNFLGGLLDHEPPFEGATSSIELAARCANCGLSYKDFAEVGRLGCSECYEHFSSKLEPLLRRIHGSTRHAGKAPGRAGGAKRLRGELDRLREELQRSIMREEYEKAAQLRDKIRELERKLG